MTCLPAVLLYTERCGCCDSRYFGSYFLANKTKIYKSTGLSKDTICFLRSLAKPLQASIMADCNIVQDYNLTDKELAVMCASHSGSLKHINILKGLMNRLKIKYSQIEIISDFPLDMRNFSGKKTKLHNNCSGKHLMMIAMCNYLGFNPKNYTDYNHPIQKLIKEKQENLSSYKSDYLSFDGCSTPLWGLPFENIIGAYFSFFHNPKYDFLWKAILKNPYIFGGFNRLDTQIISMSKKALFAKVGAGGLILVYNFLKDEILLLKLSQDNNPIRQLIVFDMLNKLGWLKTKNDDFIYNQKNQKTAKYCYEFSIN